MKTERYIVYYNKNNEEMAGEININNLDLDYLVTLIKPPETDPLLYKAYEINRELALELANKIGHKFFFDKYYYYLECYQV